MTSRFEKGGGDTTPGKYAGLSIVEMMERHLDDAVTTHEPPQFIRGLANGIAILRQPYSFLGTHPAPPFATAVESVMAASEARIAEKARANVKV